MLKIRLQRIGRKNDPSFRVVVTEHTRGPKSQNHVDRVGFYNPKTKEQKLDIERIKHWIANGAQASGTVHNMLVKAGVIEGRAVNVLPQKSPVVSEQPEEAHAAAPEGAPETTPEGDAAAEEAASDDAAAEPEEKAATEEALKENEDAAPAEEAQAENAENTDDTPAAKEEEKSA